MTNRETTVQFFKFCLVGLINTAVHYAVFYALYRLSTIHYLVASLIGYLAGLTNSYFLNRNWTFGASRSSAKIEFAKFFVVNCLALSVNLGSLKCLVQFLSIAPEYGQIAALGLSTVTNFVGNKYWTFSIDETV